jgi:hypothetical protein
MVIIKPGGRGTVTTIGVGLQVNQVFYMLTNGLQSCVEGITGLDPHIGGAELHRLCYDALQPAWRDWSGNYHLPLEKTTLRGRTIFAPIAGKARQQPVDERDAIWDQFITMRKNGEQIFKAQEIELILVIDNVDYQLAEERKDQIDELDGRQDVTKVRDYICIVFICITHSAAPGYRPPALHVGRKRSSQIPVQQLQLLHHVPALSLLGPSLDPIWPPCKLWKTPRAMKAMRATAGWERQFRARNAYNQQQYVIVS